MPAFPTKRSTKANARHAGTKPRIGQKAFILQCIKEKEMVTKRPTGTESSPGRDRKDGLSFRQGRKKSKERLCCLSRPEEDPEQVKTGQGFFFFLGLLLFCVAPQNKALGLILGLVLVCLELAFVLLLLLF